MYFSKYIGLLWYAGVSGSTIDFDTSRESKAMQRKKKDNFYETVDPSSALYYHLRYTRIKKEEPESRSFMCET